jgi:hypothetical protein
LSVDGTVDGAIDVGALEWLIDEALEDSKKNT